MSLAEFQAYYTSPRQTAQAYLQDPRKSLAQSLKTAKAKIKKAKTKTLTAYRHQYFVSKAYVDLKTASRQNEDIVIMSVSSIVVLAAAAAVTAAEILLSLSMSVVTVSDSSGISIISLVMLAAVATTILYSWFAAFLMNLLSVSLLEGATRKKIRSVRTTFRKSLSRASRVASSWFMFLGFIATPLVFMLIGTYIAIQFSDLTIYQLMTLAQFVIIAAISWVVYALLQYSLVPYVALFETDQTLTGMFGRSRALVARKGRIFTLAAYLLLAAFLLGSYGIATLLEQAISLEKWMTFGVATLAAMILFNSIMVILYRKRRLARVN